MEVFLNILIFFILAMILARLLLRLLAPWLLRKFVERRLKKFGENMFVDQNDTESDDNEEKTFGEIKVNNIPRNPKSQAPKNDRNDEEYVDFEEID